MTLPPSRLLQRLNADIAAEKNPFRADLLRAERATYLARHGNSNDAKLDLAELHKRYDTRPNVEMSAWISLAEGLLSYFGDANQSALDKLRRSNALSQAAGLAQLQAISAAWLAQLDYLRLDFPSMSKNLACALRLANQENHSAQARAALVVAQGFHTAVRLDLALPWYERSRGHALDQGDDATVSALMHNMAWIRTTNARNASLTGLPDDGEGEHVLMAAESIWSFDKLTGAASLGSYVPLLHAQVLTLRGDFQSAMELYELHIPASVDQGLGRLEGLFVADLALCRLHQGQVEAARVDASRSLSMLKEPGNCDDRAPGFSRLEQVYLMLDDKQSADYCGKESAALWAEHQNMCASLVTALATITSEATS